MHTPNFETPVESAVRHLARTTALVIARLLALAVLAWLVFSGADALGLPGVAAAATVLVAVGFVLIPRRS